MKLVVVESPAKAKTIEQYLGKDYTVVASYGHVRDLPEKPGSVRPDEDFAMDWSVEAKSREHVRKIRDGLEKADGLVLATDPDREGEAISWHLFDELLRLKALDGKQVERVMFNEVTRSAILEAMKHPRELDEALVSAYLARRALDYLVGFTLSPVLWRKLPSGSNGRGQSAGRVQSVALRLITDREAEIEQFRAREYWSVEARLRTVAGAEFAARLTHLDGRKLTRFSLGSKDDADRAVAVVNACSFRVRDVERKKVSRTPPPPFTTSTLQQEASRKLGMATDRTMSIAQKLYEGVSLGGDSTTGLITYMRTDAVTLSGEARNRIRQAIEKTWGAEYLPERPRAFRNRSKNAQEAHEAIRPTDAMRHPDEVARHLARDQARLYELIWKRAVASQMQSASLLRTTVTIAGHTGAGVPDDEASAELRAVGTVITFDGFLALYREGSDDPVPGEDEGEGRVMPMMSRDEVLAREDVAAQRHETQPPPRFTDASLVKRMEELGIGRPSTYASIIRKLRDRNYVRMERRRLLPEDRGRLVTAFLVRFFNRYVEFDFTSRLETELDDIAAGRRDWKEVLRQFWEQFIREVRDASDLSITNVLDSMTEELGSLLFPADADGMPDRTCPLCSDGRLSLKLGRHGPFIGCSAYPDCRHTRSLSPSEDGAGNDDTSLDQPRDLGKDPETGLEVTLRKGPYGPYVQLGTQEPGKGKAKPKRSSLPKSMSPGDVDLATALSLLSLPRTLGQHPESGEPVTADIGRYGPYVKHGRSYTPVPAAVSVLTIDLDQALELIAANRKTSTASTALGEQDGAPVLVRSGRYGPYVEFRKVRASIPKATDPASLTLEQALELIAAKQAKTASGSAPRRKTARKPAARARSRRSPAARSD